MIIRFANTSDYDEIKNIVNNLRSQASFREAQFNWSENSIVEELNNVNSKTMLLGDEKNVFSFLTFRDQLDLVEIMALATHSNWQKQGFQTQLILELQKMVCANVRRIVLEVHIQNLSAIALYKKLGFKEVSRRKNYYRDGAEAIVLEF